MKLTRSVSYAVGILLQVADGSPEVPVTAARIAKGCRFPPDFSIAFCEGSWMRNCLKGHQVQGADIASRDRRDRSRFWISSRRSMHRRRRPD